MCYEFRKVIIDNMNPPFIVSVNTTNQHKRRNYEKYVIVNNIYLYQNIH